MLQYISQRTNRFSASNPQESFFCDEKKNKESIEIFQGEPLYYKEVKELPCRTDKSEHFLVLLQLSELDDGKQFFRYH